MEKLEFNHIAPYLSDGLKYQMQIDNSGTLVTITVDINSLDIHVKRMIGEAKMLYGLAKPIYHPLSDLTKEIEHNGEKFVPIIELAKIAYSKNKSEFKLKDNFVDTNGGYTFHFEFKEIGFDCRYGYNGKRWDYSCYVPNQAKLFLKLFEWHFWIFDQAYFEKGIILDINILKQ